MPLPAEADDLIRPITELYRTAQRELIDELEGILVSTAETERQFRRVARLRELETSLGAGLDQLDAGAKAWLTGDLPEVYRLGAAQGGLDFGWTAEHRDAVQVIAADTYDDLLEATTYVRADTKRLIRAAAQGPTTSTILSGQTAKRQGRVFADKLADQGIKAITYKNGARHPLDSYAEMVIRTKSATAYNEGTFINGRLQGVEWYECYDGPACFAAGSRVLADGGWTGMIRARRWVGEVITFRTSASPDGLTVGPHHPVLTRRGWVLAHLLREGDEVAHAFGRGQMAFGATHAQLNHMPLVEEVFEALSEVGGPPVQRPAVGHDLHHDGARVQGEVDVVRTDRNLTAVNDSGFVEQDGESVLVAAGASHGSLPSQGGPLSTLDAQRHTPDSIVGSGHLHLPGRTVEPSPLASAPARLGAEAPGSLRSAATRRLLERSAAPFAPELEWHRVTSIARVPFDGTMYDASTVGGKFSVNGVVVKNCGLSAHADTELANGLILSAERAFEYPIAHPNCARSWGPRPDVTDADQAEQARRYSPEEQQEMARRERERVADKAARSTGRRPARQARSERAATARTRIAGEKRAARTVRRQVEATRPRLTGQAAVDRDLAEGRAARQLTAGGEKEARRQATVERTRARRADEARARRSLIDEGYDPALVKQAETDLRLHRARARIQAGQRADDIEYGLSEIGTPTLGEVPRKITKIDSLSGMRRSTFRFKDGRQAGGEWDFLETISKDERDRLTRRWMGRRDSTTAPDQLAELIRGRYPSDDTVDKALDRWRQLTSDADAARTLASGRIPGKGYRRWDPDDLTPDSPIDPAALFGDFEGGLRAVLDIDRADVELWAERQAAEEAAEEASRGLVQRLGPDPATMSERAYVDEWARLNEEMLASPTEATFDRIDELVPGPFQELMLSPADMHRAIVERERQARALDDLIGDF